MLLVLFRAVVAAGEREDQRVVALQLAEPAHGIRVVGQLVVGKDAARHNVGTHADSFFNFFNQTSISPESSDCKPVAPVEVPGVDSGMSCLRRRYLKPPNMSAREPTLLLQVPIAPQTPLLVLVAADNVPGPRLCSLCGCPVLCPGGRNRIQDDGGVLRRRLLPDEMSG